MSKRKRNSNRDARLAVQPNKNNTSMTVVAGVKAQKLDAGEELVGANNVGRDSYVAIAKKQGLYIAIKTEIRKYRMENIDSSFEQVYKHIQPLFPTVWKDPNMVSSNFKKKIEQDEGWVNAYYCNQTKLLDLAKERLYDVLNRENIDDSTVISAYDKVMKYSLAERELDTQNNNDDENTIVFGFQPSNDENLVGDE